MSGSEEEEEEDSQIKAIWECCRTGRPEDVALAVDMLKRQPHLASKFYTSKFYTDKCRLLPFHMMVVVRAPLTLLQEVHQLFPDAFNHNLDYNRCRMLPLDYICANYGNSRLDILDYVCQLYFTKCRHENCVGRWPIHLALLSKRHLPREQWPTLEMIQILFQYSGPGLIPDRVLAYPRLHHPLEWSFYAECSLEIQEYLLEKYLQADKISRHDDFRLDISLGDDQSFDRQTAELVSRVLPHHRKLQVICSKKLCLDGFLALCQYMNDNTTITSLELLKLPNEYITYFEVVWDALRVLIATNGNLESLTLSARFHVYADDRPDQHANHIFRAITEGLYHNHSLQCFTLFHMELPDTQSLSRFLSQGITVRTLNFDGIHLGGPWDDDARDNAEWQPSQHLETLRLDIWKWNTFDTFLPGLFRKLSALPSLKELTLELRLKFDIGIDMTPYIAGLLRRNRMQKLSVTIDANSESQPNLHVACVDLSRLCTECLQTNTSLQAFRGNFRCSDAATAITTLLETLQEHNATLTDIPFDTWISPEETLSTSRKAKMEYWLLLNRHDRAVARAATTTAAELVELLCQQRSKDVNDAPQSASDEIQAFNVDYGLLRESPSNWSGN